MLSLSLCFYHIAYPSNYSKWEMETSDFCFYSCFYFDFDFFENGTLYIFHRLYPFCHCPFQNTCLYHNHVCALCLFHNLDLCLGSLLCPYLDPRALCQGSFLVPDPGSSLCPYPYQNTLCQINHGFGCDAYLETSENPHCHPGHREV